MQLGVGSTALTSWQLLGVPPGSAHHPTEVLDRDGWVPATGPTTVAAALRDAGVWSAHRAVDFDETDWWWRARFESASAGPAVIRLDGVATVFDAWLNGEPLVSGDNMFVAHRATARVERVNELVIRCRALRSEPVPKSPRARWKTFMVDLPQLRWIRSSFAGRIRTWRPAAAPVGPWRPVVVDLDPPSLELRRLESSLRGRDGVVRVEAWWSGTSATDATLTVGSSTAPLTVEPHPDGTRLAGEVVLNDAPLWFPSTHGEPNLVEVRLRVDGHDHRLGSTGFRDVALDTARGGFGVIVNGVALHARGACWVPPDAVRLWSDAALLRRSLQLAVDAGVNMMRVTGVGTYEQDEFYDLCDELGILVWQDFMFANLDYPDEDPGFVAGVRLEAGQLLDRLARHPCLAVLCGGTDVEQQAIMMGRRAGDRMNGVGRLVLAACCADAAPAVPYVANTPSGGVLPFQVDTGPSSYFGVGAYLRPLDDARRAGVRFATECLAMAHLPTDGNVERSVGRDDGLNGPGWKFASARDAHADWDFDDVRDFYVGELFGRGALDARFYDRTAYLDAGRAASSICVESCLGEWRRADSSCRGALILGWQDRLAGAGWGILDSDGVPKSVYYALARSSRPRAVLLTDEGLNGLVAHVFNDGPLALAGRLVLRLVDVHGREMRNGETPIDVPAHGEERIELAGLLDSFYDLTFAYRFGPPVCDAVSVSLVEAVSGDVVSRAVHFPGGHHRPRQLDVGLTADISSGSGGEVLVRVSTRLAAQFVQLHADGWLADDNFFHLVPGDTQVVSLRPMRAGALSGSVRCLNAADRVGLRWAPDTAG